MAKCVRHRWMSEHQKERFATELANGRGRTATEENGSASLAMTVTGQSMVTRITLPALWMTGTHSRQSRCRQIQPGNARGALCGTPCQLCGTPCPLRFWFGCARPEVRGSVVVAGHTGHAVPPGRSVLKWTRSITELARSSTELALGPGRDQRGQVDGSILMVATERTGNKITWTTKKSLCALW